jgi:hypothetical protein
MDDLKAIAPNALAVPLDFSQRVLGEAKRRKTFRRNDSGSVLNISSRRHLNQREAVPPDLVQKR